jgi:hypothetical protein
MRVQRNTLLFRPHRRRNLQQPALHTRPAKGDQRGLNRIVAGPSLALVVFGAANMLPLPVA